MVSVWVCAHLDSRCEDELLIGIDYNPTSEALKSRASYSSNETDGNANAGRVTNFN